ncbi:MAG: hypothetical protein LBT97_04540 [Planctomycetota bacterium]|jgi:L-fucose isomerase-like protein|nr:hypothetical protein [Planctomycetota bacterium]
MSSRLKIGVAGAVHSNMPGDDLGVIAAVARQMRQFSERFDFDLAVWDKPIRSEEDGEAVRRFMDGENADFTLLVNASLPFGRVVLPLSRMRSRLGFWSFPEPTRDGVLQLNSFCGVNLMGSLISHYAGRAGFPGKWFYGHPDSPLFTERFLVTLRALRAVKAIGEMRIGQVGGLANGFENMYFDERDLVRKFGTYIQTRHSVEEIVARAMEIPDAEAEAEIERQKSEARACGVPAGQLEKSARIFLAFKNFAAENRYDALAVSCWPRFQEVYGIAVCGAMSRLNEDGIIAVCEADIFSTVCMAAMKAMTGGKPALNDLVAFDESDNSLNLWHCGVAPKSWADENGVAWERHFNIGRYEGEKWIGDGVVADMQFKPGRVTVVSMGGSFDRLFLLTGDVMKDKKGFDGSSGWVNNVKVNGRSVDIPTLIDTIVTGGVNHHYSSSYGDLANEWNEFAAWTGIDVFDPIPYKPYLQAR